MTTTVVSCFEDVLNSGRQTLWNLWYDSKGKALWLPKIFPRSDKMVESEPHHCRTV